MTYQTIQQSEVSPGQLVERLVQYDGPPDQFLLQLLAVQCHVGNAEHGAILRLAGGQQDSMEVLSLYPQLEENSTAPVWLSQAVELAPKVLSSKAPQVVPARTADEMYGVSASQFIVMLPIWGKQGVRGVAGFVVPNTGPGDVEESRKRLELTVTLLSLYELRLTLQRRGADLQRMKQALEVLAGVNDHKKYKAAAMSLCNQVAAAWNAERVAFGLHKGRYVKLQALSHTEKFTRKMELVQMMESAMEECLDQDAEVIYPASDESSVINRNARDVSQRSGNTMVLSLPMRRAGDPVGVLMVEKSADRPFTLEEVESLRVTCDLCTPRIVELEQRDRWFGAKLMAKTRGGLAAVVGPEHTWAKAAAIILLGVVLFATFVKGTYRVKAPFLVEAIKKQAVSVPWPGYLLDSSIQPGDTVVAGVTVLAVLDADQLRSQRDGLLADKNRALKQAGIHRDAGEVAEALVFEAEADGYDAQIANLNRQISDAKITSPISGRVMTGDLTKRLGAPMQQGDVLFEIAPEDLRAELSVEEDRIAEVTVGQTGFLAAASNPGDYIPFEVERIEPVAEVIDQKNVFNVRIKLLEPRSWMRPGMEGVAKIDIEKRPYGVIWTRELINWIRMKLWI